MDPLSYSTILENQGKPWQSNTTVSYHDTAARSVALSVTNRPEWRLVLSREGRSKG
jgi:hypothetical protein